MLLQARGLVLRPLDGRDLTPIARLFGLPEVRRHLAVEIEGGAAATRFADEFIERSRDEFRLSGSGAMAIVLRRRVGTVGYCGLRPLPDRLQARELMYAVHPACWGRGVATEAGRAVLDWGFATLPLDEVLGMSRPENTASRRVLEKLSMAYDGLSDRYYDPPLALYRLPRAAWRSARLAAQGRAVLATMPVLPG